MIFQSAIKRVCKGLTLTLSLFLIFFQSFSASAQDESDSDAMDNILEEVTVTGTKRELSLQDIPMTISAITDKELASAPLNDVRALATLAPGMVLSNPTGFNATGGGMRGTGTNIILTTSDNPVSFLVDEFPLTHVTSQFVNLFDIQQIEVFRGPQGTLFGKNTTGGVIAITSKKPVLDDYFGEIEADYGQYDHNSADIYSLKAAMNMPLGEKAALRIAAIYDYTDGYYTDDKATATFPDVVPIYALFGIPPGTPMPPDVDTTVTGTGAYLGGKDALAAKVKLLIEPSDSFSAYLIYELVRDRSDAPPGVNESVPTDFFPLLGFPGIGQTEGTDVFSTLITHSDAIQMDAGHQVDVDGVYLHLDWETSFGIFKSITSYRDEQQIFPSTYSGESFKVLFDSTRNTQRETFQQEFRFVSQFDGPFEFVTGASYYHDEFDFLAFFTFGMISLFPVFDAETGSFITADGYVNLDTRALHDYQFQGSAQDRDTYGIYWDGTYEINNKWGITFGVRYTDDEKDFFRFVDGGGPCSDYTDPRDIVIVDGECRDSRSQYISRAGMNPREFDGWNIPLPVEAFGTRVTRGDSWSETTFRLVLDYTLSDGQLVFGGVSTGFLSGGFSETCATPDRCAYNPETNTNYEIGYKADLLDNTLRFNAAAYFTEYEELQRAVVASYTAADNTPQQETVTVNLGTSEVLGVDIEIDWIPLENLGVKAALNWMDHDYTSGIIPALRTNDVPVPLELFDVPFSPEWKAMLSVDYGIPLDGGGRVMLYGMVNYQDEAETDVFNAPNTQMDSRTLVDVAVSYIDPQDRYTITGYVANLLDEEYRISALPVATAWNFTHYGPPLSYGVRVNFRF